MEFTPKYVITEQLLANIKKISAITAELNHRQFPNPVIFELERAAREVSSFASTSIEGNPLPLTEVKKILKSAPRNARQSEQEVLNYNRALEALNKKLRSGTLPLSLDLILSIQALVMDKLLPPYQTGKFRTEPVVVNDPRAKKIVYLPPDVKEVGPLMESLVAFSGEQKGLIDPLILAGIFHKQFVIIHPFMDSNGRTARLATKVLLAEMGLNTFNLFSFENYYNKNVTGYFKNVGVYGNYYELVSRVDFTSWLEYFSEGIIDELLRVQKTLITASINPNSELLSHHNFILKFIKEKGFITDKDYAKGTNRAKATRVLDLKKLINLGLIVREGKGRATYYKLK